MSTDTERQNNWKKKAKAEYNKNLKFEKKEFKWHSHCSYLLFFFFFDSFLESDQCWRQRTGGCTSCFALPRVHSIRTTSLCLASKKASQAGPKLSDPKLMSDLQIHSLVPLIGLGVFLFTEHGKRLFLLFQKKIYIIIINIKNSFFLTWK